MLKAKAIRTIIFVVVVSGFMIGVIQLFLLRFEAGDVYPAYSTLRSDPIGSRAFYAGLLKLGDASVHRNFQPLNTLEFQDNSTFFYIGTPLFDAESVSTAWIEAFDDLFAKGGRLVLSFLPVEKKPADWRMSTCYAFNADDKKNSEPSDGSQDSDDASDHRADPPESASKPLISEKNSQCVALKAQWGLRFAFADKPATKALKTGNDQFPSGRKGLPPEISWHTAFYFDALDDTWRVIYAAEGRPVIVERPLGNGSLVLSTDSFFMSNEALRSERHPELLTWAIGNSARIVFDETHLGIIKHPGVLSLIKKYRFQWFILAIAVLAALFIWKSSVYFVPPLKTKRDASGHNVLSDRDSIQGLISLLRRNIPAAQVLQTCAREWERTFQREQRFLNNKDDKRESLLQRLKAESANSSDPVAGYRRISKLISRGRHNE